MTKILDFKTLRGAQNSPPYPRTANITLSNGRVTVHSAVSVSWQHSGLLLVTREEQRNVFSPLKHLLVKSAMGEQAINHSKRQDVTTLY